MRLHDSSVARCIKLWQHGHVTQTKLGMSITLSSISTSSPGVDDMTPIYIADVEPMTKESIVRIDPSLEMSGMDHPNSKSLWPAGDDSISVKGLPVEQEPHDETDGPSRCEFAQWSQDKRQAEQEPRKLP